MQNLRNNLDSHKILVAETFEEHVNMIENIGQNNSKQVAMIEENKSMIVEKLGSFEDSVVTNIREATSHLDLSIYHKSF